MIQKSYTKQFITLSFVLVMLLLLSISSGSVAIPIDEIIAVLLGNNSSNLVGIQLFFILDFQKQLLPCLLVLACL